MTADWIVTHRSLASLGLDLPLSRVGLVGLAVGTIVLTAIAVTFLAQAGKIQEQDDLHEHNLIIENKKELAIFIAFSIIVGSSWEVLYRGFLIWELRSHVGVLGAVLIAAGAYGVAHGFKNWKMFVGSLISALIFTIAYVVTRSLWWLMLIHCGIPLIGALAVNRRPTVSLPSNSY